jgi:hypothetical protein
MKYYSYFYIYKIHFKFKISSIEILDEFDINIIKKWKSGRMAYSAIIQA